MASALSLIFLFQLFVAVHLRENTKDMDVTTRVQYDISSHKVMLYSKTYCPFSKKIKMLLGKYDLADLKIIELDTTKDGPETQRALKKISGRSTVPQLYVDGDFVGGFDETHALEKKGELRPILEKANALRRR